MGVLFEDAHFVYRLEPPNHNENMDKKLSPPARRHTGGAG